jgi:hypothetical protein
MEATTLISTIPIPTLPSSHHHHSSRHKARPPSTALALVSKEGAEKANKRVSEPFLVTALEMQLILSL